MPLGCVVYIFDIEFDLNLCNLRIFFRIVQGLNPLMFVFALVANVTYVLRFLLSLSLRVFFFLWLNKRLQTLKLIYLNVVFL